MFRSKRLIKCKPTLMVLFALLCCGALALSLASQHSSEPQPMMTNFVVLETAPNAVPVTRTVTAPEPQSSAQFDLSRNVIAGGGGTSSSGSVTVDSTIAEASAAQPISGGVFTLNGGFWNSLEDVSPTPTPTPTATPTPTPTPMPGSGSLQFSAATYTSDESAGFGVITVTRTSGTTGTVTVDFSSADITGEQRTDYTIIAGSLIFAAGEASKTFEVLLADDVYVEGSEILNLTLSNPTGGAVLGNPNTATLTITDNDSTTPTTNPLDNADQRFFVRQHFYDFLSRLPDPGGFDFWVGQITQCGANQTCINNKLLDVSNAFFFELEYQQTGAYVLRLYRAAFGNNQPFPNPDNSNQTEAKKLPSYGVFAYDRARVVGGADLAIGQQSFANAFVLRTEFLTRYPAGQDGPTFVDATLATIRNDTGIDLTSQRTALINLFNSGGRGAVLYRLADDNVSTNPINNRAFIDAEYNRAFVFTQYAGYLRRNADLGGFLFWLAQVNSAPLRDTTKQHAMVCSFITSAEFQQRFSPVVTRSNGECVP